jgi:hypothetical protein
MEIKVYFHGNDPSIEKYIKIINSAWGNYWKFSINGNLVGDVAIWWKSLGHSKMMSLLDEEFEKVLLNRRSHVGKKDTENTKSFFSCGNLSYRFMDAFNKKSLLFLVTLVACIILSMLIWIKGCKYMERIFKAHILKVKIFKLLNI